MLNEDEVKSYSADLYRLDGEIIYLFATHFAQTYQSMSASQKEQLVALANELGYLDPPVAFLYSEPVEMPEIENTDYFLK